MVMLIAIVIGLVAGAALGNEGGAAVAGGVLAWLAVGVPFLIGLLIALQKAAALF